MKRIPQRGLGQDELFQRLEHFRKDDVNWRDGRVRRRSAKKKTAI